MPLPFKPFHEMMPDDYASIGLKVGLEVHQQLRTRRKLFCRCPAGQYTNDYDAVILRHMRPTLSELGEYDGTALMEKKTRKNIYYRIHHATVCTYEFDDTPPFMIDDQALDIALEICMLLRLNLVGELHIARKQYLDGSIPTGFQRTGILGVDGWIPYRDRKIRIRQLSIEEDACREVADVGHDRVYLTDRLGMPLIETVTEPDIRTPQEAAEVGQILRLLCRSTGHVRTGYGAGRQDVNVSVTGGTRVEIKGTPQLWRNPHLIYNEARRQCSLLHIRDVLRSRGVRPDTLEAGAEDVTRIVSQSAYQPIVAALAAGHRVRCVKLCGFGGLLNEPTQEHTTFAKEFADRVRVIACLTQLPNMIHSDAASETLAGREWKDLRRKMRAQHGDALVLVWGPEGDTLMACNEIIIRAQEATEGIPNDTRQALKDGTNGFERVLPGPERMYPDTDLPPLAITEERLATIEGGLPEAVWDRLDRYRQMGLADDLHATLCQPRWAKLFDRLTTELETEPRFAATVLVQRLKAWWRDGLPIDRLTDEEIFATFRAHAEQRLSREGVLLVLSHLAAATTEPRNDATRVEQVFAELHLRPASDEELRRRLDDRLGRVDRTRFATTAKLCRYLVGVLVRELLGRADAKRIARCVHDKLQVPAQAKTRTKTTT